MYRFVIGSEEWILRFSPHIEVEAEIKQAIVSTILQLDSELPFYSHGESFIIMNDFLGMIVFHVEKIPSLILTVTAIVDEQNWYIQNKLTIVKYKK